MKMILLVISTLILVSCGRDADPVNAPKELLKVSSYQNLETDKKLDTAVREINFFAMPTESDLKNFSFTEKDYLFKSNKEAWGRIFSNHITGHNFLKNYFHKYPCYKVENGVNKDKCYLKEVRGATSVIPQYTYTCEGMIKNIANFSNLESDDRVSYVAENETMASLDTINEMVEDIKSCLEATEGSTLSGIPMNLSPLEKEIAFTNAILNMGNVRDQGWRQNVKFLRKENLLMSSLEEKFFDNYPCYTVRKGPNKGKCYLKKISRVTSTRSDRIRSCEDLEEKVTMFEGILEDDQIPAGRRASFVLSDESLAQLKEDVISCKKEENGNLKKYQEMARDGRTLRDDGKILVRDILDHAEKVSGVRYLTTSATLHDEDTGGTKLSEIYLDLKNMTISDESKIAIDFRILGKGLKYYSPSLGNMTPFTIKKKYNAIANYTYYTVHFKIFLPNGMVVETDPVEDKGLSLDVSGDFGVRISGKMHFHYPDGKTRKGVMKIEISYLD